MKISLWNKLLEFGLTRICRELGLQRSGIYRWRSDIKVPAGRLLQLERLTGIDRSEFRPDLFADFERKKHG